MSDWITDRRPTAEDCKAGLYVVYDSQGMLVHFADIDDGQAWMPITPPEPYVEPPKRYKLMYRSTTRQYYIQDTESCDKRFVASCIPTREKADRISNIFEEQNSMSEWITDRRPTEKDSTAPHYCVYDERGYIVHHLLIADGEPWKPIPKCEPYVKPKRYKVYNSITGSSVFDTFARLYVASNIINREAAERIAAIYEEVMQ